MSFINGNLNRRTKSKEPMQINIFDRNGFLTNEHINTIRQIVRDHYHSPTTEATVVTKIKNATGLKAGRVTVEHDKSTNVINVFYCCSPY